MQRLGAFGAALTRSGPDVTFLSVEPLQAVMNGIVVAGSGKALSAHAPSTRPDRRDCS
jgi:hypothetical protein